MANSLYLLGAKEGTEKVKSGEISALEWARACIERVQKVDSAIQAWASFDEKKFVDQAQTIDRKLRSIRQSGASESSLGMLCGVPVGVKDIFNTSDMPTCMGSPIWEGFTPGNDARTVFYLRQADAVIAGKTVTAEFAVHTPGKTTNPYNPEYSPGTSSSGSAAAVASFMVPLALGTQTAGSIIRPSSYCGIYGFKPTFGLIPRTGTLKTTDSLDTIGVMARNVDDLELIFETVRVHGENYPMVHTLLDIPKNQNKKTERWKVGLVTSSLRVWEKTAPYARVMLEDFSDSLAKNGTGIDLEALVLPSEFNNAHNIHSIIYDKTLSYYFKEEFKQHTLVSEIMYKIISRGQQISVEQYQEALEKQNSLSQKLDEIFEHYDVILTLSTAGQAPKGGAEDMPDSCLIWTLCGIPSMNLPLFKSPEGLPFGAQIVSKRYRDKTLLNFARYIEKLFPEMTSVSPPNREALIS